MSKKSEAVDANDVNVKVTQASSSPNFAELSNEKFPFDLSEEAMPDSWFTGQVGAIATGALDGENDLLGCNPDRVNVGDYLVLLDSLLHPIRSFNKIMRCCRQHLQDDLSRKFFCDHVDGSGKCDKQSCPKVNGFVRGYQLRR